MRDSTIDSWIDCPYLSSANYSYIEQLYKEFLINPYSVDVNWRLIFRQLLSKEKYIVQRHLKTQENLRLLTKNTSSYNISLNDLYINLKQIKILHFINAFRSYGYKNAKLDPLNLWKKEDIANLDPIYYQFTKADLQTIFNIESLSFGHCSMKLNDLYRALKKIYCSNIGAEYMHITNNKEKFWIQQRIESVVNQPLFNHDEKIRFLIELTSAEVIEHYLAKKFPGAKRFSLEGGDALIPMLKEIIRHAGKNGTQEIVLGMTHRGRLNVLVNVFGKKPQDLFDEFAGKHNECLGTGDVKYHQGFSSYIKTEGGIVLLTLVFNPSHLEIISPVVMGTVRAKIDRLNKNSNIVLPIALHGDAAISGQGVVQETLNMSKTRGYDVGGAIHIVINNQIGFTTSNPEDARSTTYCTDIAKMIQAPIFHVNADNVEAVAFIARVALDFRNIFERDVMIDLVCYRRHGHNEIDNPNATQPIMYKKIKKHPTPRKIYADYLEHKNIINKFEAKKITHLLHNSLEHGELLSKEWQYNKNIKTFTRHHNIDINCNQYHLNHIDNKRLKELAYCISKVPDSFEMQSQVAKIYHNRLAMARGEKPFDCGGAEMLAYATLIDAGIHVRLSGEDTARGTFFHRHAVIYNQKDGSSYIPLTHIHNNQGKFCVWNSVLSEEAVLAFEYGYATTESRTLVIWEAQFGDFANGAQVVIDQFISSGEQKWGQMCGLVMLLPHGYDGQGPEHSSARLERYLQLCAEQNIQVCIPSTPAQIYHMLRCQALNNTRRPLIVMSPKSILHHPLAISWINEFSNGTFQPIIDEIDNINPNYVKRVIMCSGKVYYDLLNQRRKNKQQEIAIIRIEQLYPFPLQAIRKILIPYAHVEDFVWCQEEPENQGAWYCSQHYLSKLISTNATLKYAGRPASAAPAVGYLSIHQTQQKKLVNDALTIN